MHRSYAKLPAVASRHRAGDGHSREPQRVRDAEAATHTRHSMSRSARHRRRRCGVPIYSLRSGVGTSVGGGSGKIGASRAYSLEPPPPPLAGEPSSIGTTICCLCSSHASPWKIAGLYVVSDSERHYATRAVTRWQSMHVVGSALALCFSAPSSTFRRRCPGRCRLRAYHVSDIGKTAQSSTEYATWQSSKLDQ